MKWVQLCLVGSVLSMSSLAQMGAEMARPQISTLEISPGSVTVLHLRPGYASSVRLPEEVSSVVIGNPATFKAEHNEAEPRLVFIKPTTAQPAESNALITTKSGQEVSLHLISAGKSAGVQVVDFLLEYERRGSFLVEPISVSRFLVPDSSNNAAIKTAHDEEENKTAALPLATELAKQARISTPQWRGESLQAAVGDVSAEHDHLIVPFSVLNNSDTWMELLPPQVELTGKSGNRKAIKAEPVPITDYAMAKTRLAPGQRTDGVVVFAKPAFKESTEKLQLQLAAADQVDHPLLLPLPFVAAQQGGQQ